MHLARLNCIHFSLISGHVSGLVSGRQELVPCMVFLPWYKIFQLPFKKCSCVSSILCHALYSYLSCNVLEGRRWEQSPSLLTGIVYLILCALYWERTGKDVFRISKKLLLFSWKKNRTDYSLWEKRRIGNNCWKWESAGFLSQISAEAWQFESIFHLALPQPGC